jgi:hypothetical protein
MMRRAAAAILLAERAAATSFALTHDSFFQHMYKTTLSHSLVRSGCASLVSAQSALDLHRPANHESCTKEERNIRIPASRNNLIWARNIFGQRVTDRIPNPLGSTIHESAIWPTRKPESSTRRQKTEGVACTLNSTSDPGLPRDPLRERHLCRTLRLPCPLLRCARAVAYGVREATQSESTGGRCTLP